MIKSITVTNPSGESLKLELARPELSGFIVLSATGLGPGTATLNITELSTYNGGIFNSSRIAVRNIVLSLRFLFDGAKTIEELRHISYKYFPLAKQINIMVETDERIAEIEGYVETNDPNIFDEHEGSDISIMCPNPLFRSTTLEVSTFSGIEPAFEFPFSNESLEEPLLEMSHIMKFHEKLIEYIGDADTGVTIRLRATGDVGDVTIYNTGTRQYMKILSSKINELTGSPLVKSDEIIICTIKGSKSITLVRLGKRYNILNCITRDSQWFTLVKGNNVFAYVEDGTNNLQLSVEYYNLFEGV